MCAPSWYGETIVKADEHALRVLAQAGRLRQDAMLTELSRGYDTRRREALGTMDALVRDGRASIEWDAFGYPYYVAV